MDVGYGRCRLSAGGRVVKHIFEGPDQYWSPDLPASRGQLATIAVQACRLLGMPAPDSRLEASIAIARLHAAIAESSGTPPVVVGDF